MRRHCVVALALLVAGVVALGASGAQKDPLALVLARADVPGAKLTETARGPAAIEQGLRRMGIRARVARYAYVEVPSSSPHEITVTGVVIAVGGSGDARRTFTFLKRESLSRARAKALPRFGDEQLATYIVDAGGDVLARRNTIVWALSVRAAGAKELSWAQARPEIVRYAAKQTRRVGAG
ncbi:MAG TPA: hypothetical protein VMK83_10895 [Gaiellaceae bacterium]|nr:hypothetical protein [Gaiellaceae bacterium]